MCIRASVNFIAVCRGGYIALVVTAGLIVGTEIWPGEKLTDLSGKLGLCFCDPNFLEGQINSLVSADDMGS